MIISREDGLALLSKWATESTPISAVVVSDVEPRVAIRVTGFLDSSSDDLFIGDHRTDSSLARNHMCIPLSALLSFEYAEAKDVDTLSPDAREQLARQHGIAALSIELPNGTKLAIFESYQPE